jgi:hypothetical protein
MASISRDTNGRRRIQFLAADGVRKGIRLGKVSQRIAEEVKVKVEALNAAIIAGCPIDGATAQWVAKLGDELHAKLAAVRLVPVRQTDSTACPRLGEFVDSFIAARTDHKPNTDAWPTVPESIRRAVLALIGTALPETPGTLQTAAE